MYQELPTDTAEVFNLYKTKNVPAALNQAALARDHAGAAAAAWRVSAAAILVWMVAGGIDDELVRAEVGYLGAASLLCLLLAIVYRRPRASPPAA